MTLRLVPDLHEPSPAEDDLGMDALTVRLSESTHKAVESREDRQAAAIDALAARLFESPTSASSTPIDARETDHRTEVLLGYHDALASTMVMHLSGGWTAPQTPSLSHWEARFSCERHDDTGLNLVETLPVARMTLTVVTPAAGDPLGDLSLHDQDAGELGEVLFHDDGERTAAFGEVVEDDYRPVLLIDTYEVEDGWRGTDLTPVLALRALKAFAHLGIDAAALCAAPIAEDMSIAERERVAARIGAMWTKAGFTPLAAPVTDGLDPLVMAAPLDGHALDETLHLLVGTDEALIVAAAL